MEIPQLHARACAAFGDRVRAIRDDQWALPTPCSDWDVRALVNHLVGEDLWTPPLMAGGTIGEIGDRFDGDVLGAGPGAAYAAAAAAAVDAASGPGAMERTVHLSFGDVPGSEYAMQLFSDHLIHAWDLARAIGADERLDPGLVQACRAWFADREDLYRGAGVIGPRGEARPGADEQAELLAMFGRG